MKNVALVGLSMLALGACAAPQGGYSELDGPAPQTNETTGQDALYCLKNKMANKQSFQISVGQIKDYTGKISTDAEAGGYKITQGGSLMVYSTLGTLQPSVDLVERFDTSLFQQELEYAKNQLISDNNQTTRAIKAGQVKGLDYYIIGGITEVNYNIYSGGVEATFAGKGGGYRIYSMSVAVDLRIVDAETLNVVDTRSIKKQIVGYETKAGLFDFMGGNLVDVNLGNRTQEPLQLGVRSTLQLATMKLLGTLYQIDYKECTSEFENSFKKELEYSQNKNKNDFLSDKNRR